MEGWDDSSRGISGSRVQCCLSGGDTSICGARGCDASIFGQPQPMRTCFPRVKQARIRLSPRLHYAPPPILCPQRREDQQLRHPVAPADWYPSARPFHEIARPQPQDGTPHLAAETRRVSPRQGFDQGQEVREAEESEGEAAQTGCREARSRSCSSCWCRWRSNCHGIAAEAEAAGRGQ